MLFLLAIAATGAEVQARMDADVAAGEPLIAHVLVALADNAHQGIVPTSNPALGDGQSPNTNLYWGALYGVRTHLPKAGWKLVSRTKASGDVLERATFERTLARNGRKITARIIAEAWDGRSIQKTIEHFFAEAAGGAPGAPGAPHIVAYVGHDGLMEFSVPEVEAAPGREATSAIVLACASKQYFEARLARAGAHPLLLTTNLMAPEAYTLHAALIASFSGRPSHEVHAAAARAYSEYQRSSVRATKRLFWSAP